MGLSASPKNGQNVWALQEDVQLYVDFIEDATNEGTWKQPLCENANNIPDDIPMNAEWSFVTKPLFIQECLNYKKEEKGAFVKVKS